MGREKVIKGLEICSSGEWNSTGGRDHTSCPYYPAGYTGCTCKLLMRDALALLKAQEAVDAIPVEWVKKKITGATKDLGAVIHDGVLKELLFDWQKEQEAR